jgi:hypothetical protein
MFPVWRGKLSGLPFLIAKKQVAEVKEKESRSKGGFGRKKGKAAKNSLELQVWQEKRKSCQE